MNNKFPLTALSLALLFGLMLFMASIADARGRGGGGRGGGRSFSRGSMAAGGGFSSRSTRQSFDRQGSRQDYRQDRRTERPENRGTPPENRDERRDQRPEDRDERQQWREDNRDERQERRDEHLDERQEYRDKAREDWQDWAEDEWDDRYYHGHYYGHTTIIWGGVQTTYVVTAPCNDRMVVNGVTYYRCDTVWYQRGTSDGEVVYVVVSAPEGY